MDNDPVPPTCPHCGAQSWDPGWRCECVGALKERVRILTGSIQHAEEARRADIWAILNGQKREQRCRSLLTLAAGLLQQWGRSVTGFDDAPYCESADLIREIRKICPGAGQDRRGR